MSLMCFFVELLPMKHRHQTRHRHVDTYNYLKNMT